MRPGVANMSRGREHVPGLRQQRLVALVASVSVTFFLPCIP